RLGGDSRTHGPEDGQHLVRFDLEFLRCFVDPHTFVTTLTEPSSALRAHTYGVPSALRSNSEPFTTSAGLPASATPELTVSGAVSCSSISVSSLAASASSSTPAALTGPRPIAAPSCSRSYRI